LSLGARHAYDFWIFLQRILGKKIPVSTSYNLQLMAWFKKIIQNLGDMISDSYGLEFKDNYGYTHEWV